MPPILMSMEVPIKYLNETNNSQSLDFHFCIASYVAKYPEYADFYREQSRLFREDKSARYVMLDNGAHEAHTTKGREFTYMTTDDLFDVAKFIQPQIAWAPDIVWNGPDTYSMTCEYLKLHLERKYKWIPGVIPQGRTVEEILEYVDLLLDYKLDFGSLYLGLSFHNDRDMVMRLLGKKLRAFRVHMLGLNDLREMELWPRIPITMDTSKPIKAAMMGMELTLLKRGMGLMTPDSVVPDEHLSLMKRNIYQLRAHCSE